MANRMKQLREELHMTQVRLGIELDVSQETISAYENQKCYPGFAQLLKLSDLFHASIDYIMGLSDVRNPVLLKENEKIARLIGLASQLDENQLELVLAYMHGIIDMERMISPKEAQQKG